MNLEEYCLKLAKINGFERVTTSTILDQDDLLDHDSASFEIINQCFRLNLKSDRSKKKALRYDLTVGHLKYASDFFIKNPQINQLKLFETGMAFRDGPTSLRRFKEFKQLEFNYLYKRSSWQDTRASLQFNFWQLLDIVNRVVRYFKINCTLVLNSTFRIFRIFKKYLAKKDWINYYRAIDKYHKVTSETQKEFYQTLDSTIFEKIIVDLRSYDLKIKADYFFKIEIKGLLARGFNYYRGIIFEWWIDRGLSVIAGGQFIKNFNQKNQKIRGLGLAIGYDNFLKDSSNKKIKTILLIDLTNGTKKLKFIRLVRQINKCLLTINAKTLIYHRSKPLSSYFLKFSKKYRNLLLIGKRELDRNNFILKNLKNHKQKSYRI